MTDSSDITLTKAQRNQETLPGITGLSLTPV